MAVRLDEALTHVNHALRGEIDTAIDKIGLVNRAGEFLYNVHPWAFTRRRSKLVDLRAQIDVTNATWTESSLTLTKTGGFTNYTFVEGDQFQVTGGTNALLTSSTVEYIEVLSNPATNQITLAQSLGSDADGDTDLDGTIRVNSVSLPSDFRSIISIESTDSLIRGVRLTTIHEINQVRTTSLDVVSDWNYLAALVYSGSPPVPILEIWPTPSALELGAFTLFYKKRWTRKFLDSDLLDMPEFVDHLLLEIVRAFAISYENSPAGSQILPQLLANIKAGPEFQAAVASDSSLQWNRGRSQGGGSQIYRGYYHRGNVGATPWSIAGPS